MAAIDYTIKEAAFWSAKLITPTQNLCHPDSKKNGKGVNLMEIKRIVT